MHILILVVLVVKMAKVANFMVKNKKSRAKRAKMMLPAMVLIPSFYYSITFTVGIVFGYLLCRAFCQLFVNNGRIDSIFLDFGEWKLHLHHWIMGIMILGLVWMVDYFYLPTFFAGVICGVIIQDIYDYNDWHKVIVKKKLSDDVSDKHSLIIT